MPMNLAYLLVPEYYLSISEIADWDFNAHPFLKFQKTEDIQWEAVLWGKNALLPISSTEISTSYY